MLPSNIYRLGIEHMALLSIVEEADGEITPEIEEALRITEDQMEKSSIAYAGIVKYYEGNEDAIEAEIKRLQELKKRNRTKQELFKKKITEAMNLFRIDSIDSPYFRLSFRNASSVLIEDERLISPIFFDVPPPVVSKTRIKEAIKDGQQVNGASIVTNRHLQIK